MRIIAVQSGSNGNCVYVEAHGVQLLIDAGIAGRVARDRLAALGVDIHSVDALLISHEHSDHVRSMGIFHRKFGMPIHVTPDTLAVARQKCDLRNVRDIHPFKAGATLQFGAVRVETIPTPHDAVDGVAFVVDDGQFRLGILTDLGHVFDGLPQLVGTLDAALIESNYDVEMLRRGPYPPHLKSRISGPGGHLSNVEAAELLADCGRRLQWACLGHLSEHNNAPRVALKTHRDVVPQNLALRVASRNEAVELV